MNDDKRQKQWEAAQARREADYQHRRQRLRQLIRRAVERDLHIQFKWVEGAYMVRFRLDLGSITGEYAGDCTREDKKALEHFITQLRKEKQRASVALHAPQPASLADDLMLVVQEVRLLEADQGLADPSYVPQKLAQLRANLEVLAERSQTPPRT